MRDISSNLAKGIQKCGKDNHEVTTDCIHSKKMGRLKEAAHSVLIKILVILLLILINDIPKRKEHLS